MKCYLHIGTEKTGTTSIQSFLLRNERRMKKVGYCCPKIDQQFNHRSLAVACFDDDHRDDFTMLEGIETCEQMRRYRQKTLRQYRSLFSKDKYPNVVLSSEHFQSRLVSESEVARLRAALDNFGFNEYVVIVYLREPAELAASLYCMNVKNGSTAATPGGPESPYFANVCDHRRTIERFAAQFGMSNIYPRLFSTTEFVGGNLLADFLRSIEIEETEQFIQTSSHNKGLSNLGIELMRRVNAQIPISNEHGNNPLYPKIVEHFETYYSQSKYCLPLELADRFRESFAGSCDWVRSRFFPDRNSLFEPLNRQNDVAKFNADELDIIAKSIAGILLGQEEEAIGQATTNDRASIWSFIQNRWAS